MAVSEIDVWLVETSPWQRIKRRFLAWGERLRRRLHQLTAPPPRVYILPDEGGGGNPSPLPPGRSEMERQRVEAHQYEVEQRLVRLTAQAENLARLAESGVLDKPIE